MYFWALTSIPAQRFTEIENADSGNMDSVWLLLSLKIIKLGKPLYIALYELQAFSEVQKLSGVRNGPKSILQYAYSKRSDHTLFDY